MGEKEFHDLREFLDKSEIKYKITEHRPVFTSEEAAKVRGRDLKQGVKAMVCETFEGVTVLALIAADKKIDFRKLTDLVSSKKLTFSSPEKVLEKTGCKTGSVHPFGNLFKLPTFMDKSILDNYIVNFNAGMNERSIEMKRENLVRLINPKIGEFSRIV